MAGPFARLWVWVPLWIIVVFLQLSFSFSIFVIFLNHFDQVKVRPLGIQQVPPTSHLLLLQFLLHYAISAAVMNILRVQLSLMPSRSCLPVENDWWFDLNFLSWRCVRWTHDYCVKNAIIRPVLYCSICCVALPSSSQQHSPPLIEALVASERSSKLPDFSCQPWAKTACDILPSRKLTSHLSLFVSRFVGALCSRMEHWWIVFSLPHKNCKPQNKIEQVFCTLMT